MRKNRKILTPCRYNNNEEETQESVFTLKLQGPLQLLTLLFRLNFTFCDDIISLNVRLYIDLCVF